MHLNRGRVALAIILVASLMTVATADPGTGAQNDAGTGADAGNERALATTVQLATLYGASLRPNDIDWFQARVSGDAPACVVATARAGAATYFALGAESSRGTTTAPFLVGANGQGSGGVAGIAPLNATLRARLAGSANFGQYDFRLDRVVPPASGTDASGSTDAGSTAAGAVLVSPGCVGGTLTALDRLDMRDLYAIAVPSGQVLTYSLAAASQGMALTVVDAAGNLLGPALAPGEAATVAFPEAGTYYMSASVTTATGSVGYTIGSIVGPEPTGCRPYCLD